MICPVCGAELEVRSEDWDMGVDFFIDAFDPAYCPRCGKLRWAYHKEMNRQLVNNDIQKVRLRCDCEKEELNTDD